MPWNEFQKEPNWEAAHFSSGGNVAGLAEALAKQRYQNNTGHALVSAMQTLTPALAKEVQSYKADQVAQTLLDQASNYDNESPSQAEQIARQLNESNVGPSEAWTAYRQLRTDQIGEALKGSEINYHNAMADYARGGKSQANWPEITLPDGTTQKVPPQTAYKYWYGGGSNGGSPAVNSWENAVAIRRGKANPDGTLDNQYTGAESGPDVELKLPTGKTVVVPWDSYQGKVGGRTSGSPQQDAAQTVARDTTKLSPEDQQALDWAKANPNDPRSKQILQRLGML